MEDFRTAYKYHQTFLKGQIFACMLEYEGYALCGGDYSFRIHFKLIINECMYLL